MPSAPRFTRSKRAVFLARLADTANVSASCAAAGISRHVAYALKRLDAAFAAQWEEALQIALDGLESEIIRRAIEGTAKEQFFQGQSVGTVVTYSDSLAMFLLKSKRPEVYGDLKAVAQPKAPLDDEAYDSALQRLLEALEVHQGRARS